MFPRVTNSLYNSKFEHDACGVGFVANTNGKKERRILDYALEALCNLAHRGALDADAKTGDGAGVMIQIPQPFFQAEAAVVAGLDSVTEAVAVGFVFLPSDSDQQVSEAVEILQSATEEFGMQVFGWRDVPVNPKCLGDKARSTMPFMKQILVGRGDGWDDNNFERHLFLARKVAGQRAREKGIEDFYIASFSSQTVVYKGLFNAPQLGQYYQDLQSPLFETSLAVFHQRYSTNTFPTWRLAHPYRTLAHNGEINTLLGNKNWTRAREQEITSPIWGDNIEHLRQIIQPESSDSAALDNALEILRLSGRNILHSVLMLAPEAWEKMDDLDPEMRAFYRYHACLNEPWDGPAAVVFTDGRYVGATLDRNGLRPARYKLYKDGLIVFGSEAGMVELDDADIQSKGRLGPGKIMAIDTLEGRLMGNDEVKRSVASQQPYGQWCDENMVYLRDHAKPIQPVEKPINLLDLTLQQIAFGWDSEELKLIFKPMITTGAEAIGSMGDDTPLAILSKKPRLLYSYFKQLFAQVTNPAIDSIREKVVMSLSTCMGHRRSWLEESPKHASLLRIDTPFLLEYELAALANMDHPDVNANTIGCHFPASGGTQALVDSLRSVCDQASEAVENGCSVIILSDRGTNEENVPIPMLLAVGAVHHHLIREGKRLKASIVCETGEARDVHHFACLVGFGASAVNPYVAIDLIREWAEEGELEGVDIDQAIANYRTSIENGMLKIMAKMGISTMSSYRGAQVFEAVGISDEVIDECFYGTTSQIGGITFEHIASDAIRRHQQGFGDPESATLDEGGHYKVLPGDRGEFHAFNKKVVQTMHKFLRSGERDAFLTYLETAEKRDPVNLRDLFQLKPDITPISLEQVEPIDSIRMRFTTAAMSMGALSPEAHECLAIAMNRIGGKSNSGEGGEDAERFNLRENGDNASSAIKQVASGRFGVTPEYLASAQEIEIKVSQGAKPGEGGQLPGHKVTPLIATLRHSTPGVPLISPPPHHDIYSIEDLAQLIYDLKQVNPRAKVCVKLVACAGVGTIAAGVAKAFADVILISGNDGGTGASPQSSIKNAGVPFELGLAEAQQTLMLNDLRSRVILRTDGGLKTGSDIVMGALLGAEEFNFGTAALIAAGCAMFRVCHLNTCPVGVATQREDLRLKFRGKPENVVAFFDQVAQEVREIMASLGIRKFNDLVGRTDFLEVRPVDQFDERIQSKAGSLNLEKLLWQADESGSMPRIHTRERNERFGDSPLDDRIVNDAKHALKGKGSMKLKYKINNVCRNIGTRVSGIIGYTYGDTGLPAGSIDLTLTGSAGQGFGTFLAKGLILRLLGEANDYVGKGMNGGDIIVRPQDGVLFDCSQNVILGNTCLYGATGGRLFAAGTAGERFCVRNSGAVAVVEGVGDHGCEYMTGGKAIILGDTGRNFAAGMSGGVAYVHDMENRFPKNLNSSMVDIERLESAEEIHMLKSLVQEHFDHTGSSKGAGLLQNWAEEVSRFWKIIPHPPEAKPASKPVHELNQEKAIPAPTGSF